MGEITLEKGRFIVEVEDRRNGPKLLDKERDSF
jgi:hypothetical protein